MTKKNDASQPNNDYIKPPAALKTAWMCKIQKPH